MAQVSGIVLGTICVALNNGTDTEIGTYLGACILLASVLTTGPSLTKMILAVTGVK